MSKLSNHVRTPWCAVRGATLDPFRGMSSAFLEKRWLYHLYKGLLLRIPQQLQDRWRPKPPERIEAQRETTSRNWVAADTRGTGGAAQGTLYLVIVPWLFPPKTNPIAIFWFRFCSFVYTWYCLIEVVHPEVWDLGQHAQQKSRMSCWVKLKGDETLEASLGICMHDLFQHISNHHILDVLCLVVVFFIWYLYTRVFYTML